MKSLALVALGALLGVGSMLCVPNVSPQVVLAGTPSGNGDVNASGGIDIGDAIYILGYLFAQGPAPEVIECDTCCPPPSGGALLATGQTACYTAGGVVIDCNSAEYPGQDGFYQAGCPSAGRFTDNGDGTVTDNCTGLEWQKNTADIDGDGTIAWEQDALTWQNALKYCESLEFASHADWRLPNLRELLSILDYGRYAPSIDPVFGVEFWWYWSSSTIVYPWTAGFVDFEVGGTGCDDKGRRMYVRGVRGGL